MSRAGTIVVGGGASGTLAAIHLLEHGREPVVLVERTLGRLSRGAAYTTTDPGHLLNVPAAGLAVSSRAPEAFARWLQRRLPGAHGGTFAPRRLYGDYLGESLLAAAAVRPGRLQVVRDEAVALAADASGVEVGLGGGATLAGARAVLALGPPASGDPLRAAGPLPADRYILDPWAEGSLDAIESGDVLLIGSGLTAVDVALTLSRRPVRLRLVSRHGLLPETHLAVPSLPLPPAVDGRQGPSHLLRALRAAAAADGDDWRAILDGLRPATQRLWHGLGPDGQDRFLRHAATYWNVHRHRMAPATAERVDELRRAGRLTVRAGAIVAARRGRRAVELLVRSRRGGEVVALGAAHVVNCTGPALRLPAEPPALLRGLLQHGLARLDVHGIGLATGAEGALLDTTGTASDRLFAIGALRRGELWESTAIPELRAQAEGLALLLGSRAGEAPVEEVRAADGHGP